MARLEDVIPKAEEETILAKKTFKDNDPDFIHVDIKYWPQMPDESARRYLFVAIDRATSWVFLHIYGDMSDKSSADFLRGLADQNHQTADLQRFAIHRPLHNERQDAHWPTRLR